MDINERKILEKINEKLKNKEYEEARLLLENTFFDKSYARFIEYMTKVSIDGSKTMLSEIDGKQVFSDGASVYIMEEPFDLDIFIEKSFTTFPDETMKILKELKKYIQYSKRVKIYKNISERKPIDIITSSNEALFQGKYVKPTFDILSGKVNFKLSDSMPLLMAEGKKGKAYIFGLKNTSMKFEIRKFYDE